MAILIIKEGGRAEKVDRTAFEVESDMQEMLVRNPDMIPMYEIDEDIKLLIVRREMRVKETDSDKFADAVAVDKDASIYLVETKLFKNPDKRQVVAQVLSYGASLWANGPTFGEFMEGMNESCQDLFEKDFLELVWEYFAIPDQSTLEEFKDALSASWDKGTFKFIVYMDKVSEELRNLVTYINQTSRFAIYVVGVDYYKYEGMKIVIPKLHGVPARIEKDTQYKSPTSLTMDSYLQNAKERLEVEYPTFLRLFEALHKATGDDSSFRFNSTFGGSYTPRFGNIQARAPFSLKASGDFQVYFTSIEDDSIGSARELIRSSLVEMGMMKEDTVSRQPLIPFKTWKPRTSDIIGLIGEVAVLA